MIPRPAFNALMRRAIKLVFIAAFAAVTAGCGGAKQLRTLQNQSYINSVPVGAEIDTVVRDLDDA